MSVTRAERPYHHGDLRAALIRSALELLERSGPEQLSLRGLAEEAGVSRSAPYSHFRDKRELLAAIAEVGFERFAEAMTEGGGADAHHRFLAVGRGYARFALAQPNLFKLMFSAELASLQSEGGLKAAGGRTQGIFREALDAFLIEQGAEAPASVALQTLSWGLIHGLCLLLIEQRLPARPEDPQALVEEVMALFTAMVRTGLSR